LAAEPGDTLRRINPRKNQLDGDSMQIDKSQILELLRSQGDDNKAQQADQELPQQVDTDQHAGLLSKLGLNPQDLIAKLAGGGAGGIAGKLGL
jgi:hypothetical protein